MSFAWMTFARTMVETLGDGELIDHCLVCPRHGAHFDVRTGDAVTMPATEPTVAHEVRVTGDEVFVRLKD